jgi:antitoxin ParD1/3/4
MAISADLGTTLETYVEALVEKGRYGSKSEVIREGIRLVQERETRLAALHAAIQVGIDAANAGDVYDEEEVFAEINELIESKIKAIA